MTGELERIPWARKLKLRHFEMLLVLFKLRSITSAARELHMTQPAMSHWLADLEEVVGAPIFLRGRQLKPTLVGEVLHRHAQRMLGDVFRVHNELASVRAGLAGQLQIGTITSAAPSLIPEAVKRVQSLSPRLRVQVTDATFEVLLERLRQRELDVVIGPLDMRAYKSGFASEVLLEDAGAVVVGPGHPLARRQKPTWNEAATLPWIMPPVGTLMRAHLENAFRRARAPIPEPSVETASLVVAQMLLRHGDYVSVLAESVARIYSELHLVAVVRLSPKVDFGDIGMLWDPNSLDTQLFELLAVLRDVARVLRAVR